jgi:hypothetical protein
MLMVMMIESVFIYRLLEHGGVILNFVAFDMRKSQFGENTPQK